MVPGLDMAGTISAMSESVDARLSKSGERSFDIFFRKKSAHYNISEINGLEWKLPTTTTSE